MTTRWGFIATGTIATSQARDLALTEGAQALAVASRDEGRARAFADRHGFERAYGSYDALLADPDVDVVYVATPHAQHHAVVTAALRAGKPVLVEKSMTCTAAAARDLVALARAQGLFLMEAMWTRFQPNVVRLRELLAEGAIGDVRTVTADFGFRIDPSDTGARLWDPAQGGGAMLDAGVYPVSFAQMLLGAPSSLQVTGVLAPNGVDAEAALLLGFPGGQQALLATTLVSRPPSTARVVGTDGWIDVEGPMFRTPALHVHRGGAQEAEVVSLPATGANYVHQLRHVQECLAQGLTESPVMPLDDTLAVMEVLDRALEQLGARHADEGFPAAEARA
jgi:predicted dehydrogenase